ncbi:hypothetical protein WKW79_35845 [Variovorax robiniae]|uniref:Uncharacterized protein n=1 Tax=Variovorax robiniae TaxID=1836199 RepID=A0ABU8XJB9_9BURK
MRASLRDGTPPPCATLTLRRQRPGREQPKAFVASAEGGGGLACVASRYLTVLAFKALRALRVLGA